MNASFSETQIDSTDLKLKLQALEEQNANLLNQISILRNSHRENAEANIRLSQQWQQERDRNELLWQKLQEEKRRVESCQIELCQMRDSFNNPLQQSDHFVPTPSDDEESNVSDHLKYVHALVFHFPCFQHCKLSVISYRISIFCAGS
jgi:hypothetical protein